MTRPLRIQFENTYFHFTCRGNAREEIFRDDEDRRVLRLAKRIESKLIQEQRFDLSFPPIP